MRLEAIVESGHWSTYRYAAGMLQAPGFRTVRLFTAPQGHMGQGFSPMTYVETNLLIQRGRMHWHGPDTPPTFGPEDDDGRDGHPPLTPSLDVRSVHWSVSGGSYWERAAFTAATSWRWEFGNCMQIDGTPLDFAHGDGDRRQRRRVYDAIRRAQGCSTIGAMHLRTSIVIPEGRPFCIQLETRTPLEVASELQVRFTLYARARYARAVL